MVDVPMGTRRSLVTLLLGALTACGGGGGDVPPPVAPFVIPDGLVRLPGATSAASRIYSAPHTQAGWCVYRTWPEEALRVFRDCGASTVNELPFARGSAGEILSMAIASDDDQIFLVTYDARENIPSGRILGVVSEGVDVYRFRANSNGQPELVADNLPLSGFDGMMYASVQPDGLAVCLTNRCYSLIPGQMPQAWDTSALRDQEIVELTFSSGQVAAIVRSKDVPGTGSVDPESFRFSLAIGNAQGFALRAIAPDCVPYRLNSIPIVTYECAAGPAAMADLLRFELARMPNEGNMDLGTSNLEGRVAWSQVYYLHGLISLTGGWLPTLAASGDWSSVRTRTHVEVDLLARRAELRNGLVSRRYSMQRSAELFALHVGRSTRALRYALDAGLGSERVSRALVVSGNLLQSLTDTVEEPRRVLYSGIEFSTLGYPRGSDFWCDGANVPHNYVSGYIDGLLASSDSPGEVARAGELVRPLLTLEDIAGGDTWGYWWGPGREGWTAESGLSINTPAYSGFRGVADITYRSMDSVALLRLRARGSTAVSDAIVANIRRLVGTGQLLPWVNEALMEQGGSERLEDIVAMRYARSAAPWELQAQVWALEQLARGN